MPIALRLKFSSTTVGWSCCHLFEVDDRRYSKPWVSGKDNPLMYAKSSPADVYHLLTPDEDYTRCGLSVVSIIIDRPVNTSALHLTSQKPIDRKLCNDCAKAEASESKG